MAKSCSYKSSFVNINSEGFICCILRAFCPIFKSNLISSGLCRQMQCSIRWWSNTFNKFVGNWNIVVFFSLVVITKTKSPEKCNEYGFIKLLSNSLNSKTVEPIVFPFINLPFPRIKIGLPSWLIIVKCYWRLTLYHYSLWQIL